MLEFEVVIQLKEADVNSFCKHTHSGQNKSNFHAFCNSNNPFTYHFFYILQTSFYIKIELGFQPKIQNPFTF
jgi:hypothetical protein